MTRKDYQLIANRLAGEYAVTADNLGNHLAVRNVVLGLADAFAQDNPRFDRAKFYQAVGLR